MRRDRIFNAKGRLTAHHITHHLGRPAGLCIMHDGLVAQEHPVITVQSLNTDAGLITRDNLSLTQVVDNLQPDSLKRLMTAFEHIGQCALADIQPEHLIKHPRQPDKRNRRKGLQVQNQGVQPGAKRRAIGS
jgi:hypothetical protein